MFNTSRLFVLCLCLGLCWSGTGCFRQGPAEESVIQQPSVYTLVLQGYESGTVRRDFQALLQQLALQPKLLQAGANQAEYLIYPGQQTPADWQLRLQQFMPGQYRLEQQGECLLLSRL